MLHHTDSLSKCLTSIHQIVKILSKITQPWKIGHNDLYLMTQKPRSYGCLNSDIILLEGIRIKEKAILFKVSQILTSSPTPGHEPWGQNLWHGRRPFKVSMVQNECFLMSGWWDIPHLRNFNVKLCGKFHQHDGRTNRKMKTIYLSA